MADPRGLRNNNNPGNIRHSTTTWEGMADVQGDPSFVSFQEPKFGIRALGRVLNTYNEKHGLKTIRGVVSRWAPPNENDTEAYIKSVAKQTGFEADAELDLKDPETVTALTKAIILHENGKQPFDDETILEGLRLAGTFRFSDAPEPAVPEDPERPPLPGTVQEGYRYRGGNPADPNSWEKVQ